MAQKKSRLSQRHDRIFCATMCSLVHVMCTSNNSDPLERKSEPEAAAGTAPLARRLGTTASRRTCRLVGCARHLPMRREEEPSAQWRLDTTRVYPCRAVRPLGVASVFHISIHLCPVPAPLAYTLRTCWWPTAAAPAPAGQIAWPQSRSSDDDDSTARVQARRRRPGPLP